MENPIRMDDLGVPLFLETPISCYLAIQPAWILYVSVENTANKQLTNTDTISVWVAVGRIAFLQQQTVAWWLMFGWSTV